MKTIAGALGVDPSMTRRQRTDMKHAQNAAYNASVNAGNPLPRPGSMSAAQGYQNAPAKVNQQMPGQGQPGNGQPQRPQGPQAMQRPAAGAMPQMQPGFHYQPLDQMWAGGGQGFNEQQNQYNGPTPPPNQGWEQGLNGGWSNPGMAQQQALQGFAQGLGSPQQGFNQMPGQNQGFQNAFQNQQPFGIPRSPMPMQNAGSSMVNNMTQQQRNPNYTQGR